MTLYTEEGYYQAVAKYKVVNPAPYATYKHNAELLEQASQQLAGEGKPMLRGFDLFNQHRWMTKEEVYSMIGATMKDIPEPLLEPTGSVKNKDIGIGTPPIIQTVFPYKETTGNYILLAMVLGFTLVILWFVFKGS